MRAAIQIIWFAGVQSSVGRVLCISSTNGIRWIDTHDLTEKRYIPTTNSFKFIANIGYDLLLVMEDSLKLYRYGDDEWQVLCVFQEFESGVWNTDIVYDEMTRSLIYMPRSSAAIEQLKLPNAVCGIKQICNRACHCLTQF